MDEEDGSGVPLLDPEPGYVKKPLPQWAWTLIAFVAFVVGFSTWRWYVGLGTFFLLAIVLVYIEVRMERAAFQKYLAALPPGPARDVAINQRYPGLLTEPDSEEYRRMKADLEREYRARLEPIEAEIKKLEEDPRGGKV